MVGIPKTEFPGLLKALMETANPGQHLPAVFNKFCLIPINPARVMERIPSRSMAAAPGTTRELLNSTFSERLEELRGVDQKKVRGEKSLKLPPASHTQRRTAKKR